MSKKKIYQRSLEAHRFENLARSLSSALLFAEENDCMFVVSNIVCPRCNEPLRDLREARQFKKFFSYCPHCQFFLLFNGQGHILTFDHRPKDKSPISLPPKKNPHKPLERSIWKHMRSVKKESD